MSIITQQNKVPRQKGLQPLLKAEEVAARLLVSKKTVHKLAREKKLACVQVTGRERRFTAEQICEFIERQSRPVRVDKNVLRQVSSPSKKGGVKSSGVSGTGLAKEIRSLCRS